MSGSDIPNSGNISLQFLTKLYINLLFFTSKNCIINSILLSG